MTVAELFDAAADRYDDAYRSRRCRVEDYRIRALLAGRTEGRVLDIGAGSGQALRLLGIPEPRYTGVDVSPGMIARGAATHPRAQWVCANALDYLAGQPSRSVDRTVSLYALPYIAANGSPFVVRGTDPPEPAWQFMRALARVVRSGGLLSVVTYGPGWRPPRSTVAVVGSGVGAWTATARTLDALANPFLWHDVKVVPLSGPLAGLPLPEARAAALDGRYPGRRPRYLVLTARRR